MRNYLIRIKHIENASSGIWYSNKIGGVFISNFTKLQKANYHCIDGIRYVHVDDAEVISKHWTEDMDNILFEDRIKKTLIHCGHVRLTNDISRCYYCEATMVNAELLSKILYKDVYLKCKK
jgi:hypothetical protein